MVPSFGRNAYPVELNNTTFTLPPQTPILDSSLLQTLKNALKHVDTVEYDGTLKRKYPSRCKWVNDIENSNFNLKTSAV